MTRKQVRWVYQHHIPYLLHNTSVFALCLTLQLTNVDACIAIEPLSVCYVDKVSEEEFRPRLEAHSRAGSTERFLHQEKEFPRHSALKKVIPP